MSLQVLETSPSFSSPSPKIVKLLPVFSAPKLTILKLYPSKAS